ncbi:MAG TPA: hypothetical protein VGP80_13890 [Gemmatimonadales bacterium]|nr:hypothetical protein [Gemmatimonadales bacterium]
MKAAISLHAGLLACGLIIAWCTGAGCAQQSADGSNATPAPRDGQHDFDFEIGTWKTHLSRLQHPLSGSTTWVEYEGTSVVRKVWDGRANLVELEVDGPGGHVEGLSLRLYNPQSHQWSLNFANARSGTLSVPTVGEFKDGRGEFYDWEDFNGRMILVRNVWKDITPNSGRFEQSFSDDGGKTWELNWIAIDTRTGDIPEQSADDRSRDFDFEIGSWRVHNSRLLNPLTGSTSWIEFEGTAVARKVWNGRADLVELESDPPSGHNEALILRLYNPETHQWSVTFASSRGGTLTPPAIGQFRDGRAEFYDLEPLDDGRIVLARAVLSDISPTSYRLEQAFSADGGKTWEKNWVSVHTRVGN